MLKRDGSVQRMDLNLRIKYIGLQTEIYKIDEYNFVIHCKNYTGNFGEMSEDFDKNIRHIGSSVTLSKCTPTTYIKRLENIPLSNVVNGFKAVCITKNDIETFIKSKFYNIDIIKISTPQLGIYFEIVVEVSKNTNENQIKEMQDYLIKSDLHTDKVTIKYAEDETNIETDAKEKVISKDISHDVMPLTFNKKFPFIISETDYWLEHAENIYNGTTTRKDLAFYRENSLKCFLDFTIFDNINIRNVLLLYDTVYIAMPIEDHLIRFLDLQGMRLSELIELIDMGKVVLLLPNHEERYDKSLLTEVYKKAPASIVGRRGINTLLTAYLSETRHQYEQRFPGVYNLASDMFMEGAKSNDKKLQNIARLVAWPITATAASFGCLHRNSPMSISSLGVNRLFEGVNVINNTDKKTIDAINFEFNVNATSTHIAAALNATYFPFIQTNDDGDQYSDAIVSQHMGNLLKSYWYDESNIQKILDIDAQNENSFLNLFDCKNNISITKVAEMADQYKTHEGFRDILVRLDKMGEIECKAKLREYNDVLFEIGKCSKDNRGIIQKFMLGGVGFIPTNYIVSFIINLFGLTKDMVDTSELMIKHDELRRIEKCIKDNGIIPNKQTLDDIYLLDKISRVAILK